MTVILERKVKQLERQKEATLSVLEPYSQTQLAFRPSPGSWSLLEVVDHLQKTEHGILRATLQSIPLAHAQSMKDRIRAQLLIGLFLLPSRVKVPGTVSSILPEENLCLLDLKKRWGATRVELTPALAELPPGLTGMAVFRHPVSGWMTIDQTLGFLSAHITHHDYQIRRIQRALPRN